MKPGERIKMFKDVFAPKSEEKILFLVDIPHDNLSDSKKWIDRREMAKDWYNSFLSTVSDIFPNLSASINFVSNLGVWNTSSIKNWRFRITKSYREPSSAAKLVESEIYSNASACFM